MRQDATNERFDDADATLVRRRTRRPNAPEPNAPARARRRSAFFAFAFASCVGLAVVPGFAGCRSLLHTGDKSRVAPTARGEYALPSTEAVDDWEKARAASVERFGGANGGSNGSTTFRSAAPANAPFGSIASTESTAETRVARKPFAAPEPKTPEDEKIERGAAPFYYNDDELPPLPEPPKSFGRRVEEFFSFPSREEAAAKKQAKAAERARKEAEKRAREEAEAFRRQQQLAAQQAAAQQAAAQQAAAQQAAAQQAAAQQAAARAGSASTLASTPQTQYGSTRSLDSTSPARSDATAKKQTPARSFGSGLTNALGFGAGKAKSTRKNDPVAGYDERRFMPAFDEIEQYYSPSGAPENDSFDESADFAVAGGKSPQTPEQTSEALAVDEGFSVSGSGAPTPKLTRQIGARSALPASAPVATNVSDEFDENAGFAVSSSAPIQNFSLPEPKLAETTEPELRTDLVADLRTDAKSATPAPVSPFPLRKRNVEPKQTELAEAVAETNARAEAARISEEATAPNDKEEAIDMRVSRARTSEKAASLASQLGTATFEWFDEPPADKVAAANAFVESKRNAESFDDAPDSDFDSANDETDVDADAVLDAAFQARSKARTARNRREPAVDANESSLAVDVDASFAELDPNAEGVEPEYAEVKIDDEPQYAEANVDAPEYVDDVDAEVDEPEPRTAFAADAQIADETPVDANEVAWVEQTQTAIRALLAERAAKLERGEDVRADDARLRLLFLAVGERDRAIQELRDEKDPLRVFWENECGGLATLLQESPDEIDPALVADRLRAGLDSFEGVCDLRIGKGALVETPACFGLYEERVDAYRPGETALAYFELEFVDSEETANGFEIDVECEWRLVDGDGNERSPVESRRCENYSESRLRDVVLNVSAPLPEDLEPGVYWLETTVVDRNRPGSPAAANRLPLVVEDPNAPATDVDESSSDSESEDDAASQTVAAL